MRKLSILIFLCFIRVNLFSQIPERPYPPRLLNDFAGIFTTNQRAELENYLVMIDDSTSNQICVVSVIDLGDVDIASYATELGEKWGVGSATFDNGIVIVIRPKTTQNSGNLFIAVGRGLEGVIPDAIAKRISDQIMIPYFIRSDYFGGTIAGVDYLYRLSKGEVDINREKESESAVVLSLIIILLLFFFLIFLNRKKNSGNDDNGNNTTHRGGVSPWIFFGGGYGGRRSSGSLGGGFGGFGGGRFGGGGAGGRW